MSNQRTKIDVPQWVNEIWLCEVRVVLNLEGRNGMPALCEEVVERLTLKVEHADRFCNALIKGGFK